MMRALANRYGTKRGFVRGLLAQAERLAGRLRRYTAVDFGRVRRLVFVCRGNICRSSFAECVAQREGVLAASFGLSTGRGQPAYPGALAAAWGLGYDLGSHRTTRIEDFTFDANDLLIAMEVRQSRQLDAMDIPGRPQITLLGLWVHPERPHIHDPYGLDEVYFRSCFLVIEQATRELCRRSTNAGVSTRSAHESRGDASDRA
jgi:protein-tyrosine phosphatase